MASESVKILIEADDQASAKIAQTSQKIEQNVKKIKDVGGKAKASTEFLGQLAGQLGGSEIASFAGQMAGLTEKVGQFAEISKAGGAGAFAFKAGIVGLVGAMSFGFGQAIGNAIFETDRWKKELEDATAASKKLNAELIRFSDLRISDEMQAISLLGSPEEQEKASAAMVDNLRKQAREASGVAAELRADLKNVDTFDSDAVDFFVTTDAKQRQDELKLQIQLQDELSNSISKQAVELERKLNVEMKNAKVVKELAATQASSNYVQSLRDQLELEKAIGDEKFKLEARKTATSQDVGVAANLLKQLDALKQIAEADRKAAQEKEQAAEKERVARQRVIDLITNENQKNQERLVLLNKGTEAAKVFSLVQQGVSETEAKRLAAESDRIGRLEKNKQNQAEVNKTLMQPQEAFQSRFLTRGPMANPNERLEKEAEKQTRLAEEQKKLLEDLRENTKERKSLAEAQRLQLEIVG